MSYEINTLRSLLAYVEPAGSYALDNSGTIGDFLAVPITEGFMSSAPMRDMLDPMLSQARLDGRAERVIGKRSAAMQLAMLLASHGVDMVGNETQPASTTWALRRLLTATMGGVSLTGTEAAATTVQAGTSTSVVNVSTGHGDRWIGNRVIACQTVSGSTALEAREVLSVSGDAVTVKEAFSATPVTGTQVRGGVTFHPTEDPDTSLQFIAQGRETADHFLMRGMQGGFQIEAKPGQLAKITFDLKGAATTKLSDHSGITVPSFSNWSPVAVVASELTVPTVGSTTRAWVAASDISLTLGLAYEPVTGYSLTGETIIRMRRQRPRDGVLARLTFTAPLEDSTWIDHRDNRTDLAAFWQIGSAGGGGWLISIPTCQVTDVRLGPSASGLSGQIVTLEGRLDASAAASTTELSYAALRLHAF
jgi:hypothetical protein